MLNKLTGSYYDPSETRFKSHTTAESNNYRWGSIPDQTTKVMVEG